MTAKLYVVVVKGSVVLEGELQACTELAKTNGGTIKTLSSINEAKAREAGRKAGGKASKTAQVLIANGTWPIEAVQAAIKTLETSKYKNSGLMDYCHANKPLSKKQVAVLMRWAGEVAGEKKAIDKLAKLVA